MSLGFGEGPAREPIKPPLVESGSGLKRSPVQSKKRGNRRSVQVMVETHQNSVMTCTTQLGSQRPLLFLPRCLCKCMFGDHANHASSVTTNYGKSLKPTVGTEEENENVEVEHSTLSKLFWAENQS